MVIEVEGESEPSMLPGDGAALAAFCSFCAARGFGAQHPLLALAEALDLDHGVRVGPFTHFYDATIEDAEDAEKLEYAWQPAAGLAASAEAAAAILRDDERAAGLAAAGGAAGLADQLQAVAERAGHATEAGARVRLTYTL